MTKKFIVHFNDTASATVRVDADDVNDAIDAAEDFLPCDMCSECSNDAVTFDSKPTMTREWPENMQPYEVTDADGEIIWRDNSDIDNASVIVNQLEKEVDKAQKAMDLLEEFVSSETNSCRFDHNGNCQEHGSFNNDRTCVIGKTKKFLYDNNVPF